MCCSTADLRHNVRQHSIMAAKPRPPDLLPNVRDELKGRPVRNGAADRHPPRWMSLNPYSGPAATGRPKRSTAPDGVLTASWVGRAVRGRCQLLDGGTGWQGGFAVDGDTGVPESWAALILPNGFRKLVLLIWSGSSTGG